MSADSTTTVREATFDLLRAHGMTTIFGNPGSTELPMLADFPDGFTYVLGLQELVVVGMAGWPSSYPIQTGHRHSRGPRLASPTRGSPAARSAARRR